MMEFSLNLIDLIIMYDVLLGACDSLLLDLSGSLGSGGLVWNSTVFRVTSSAPNTSTIESFLNTHYSINSPTPVPQRLLAKGFAYTISVKLCNFLGSCNQNAVTVVVVTSIFPSVSIPGPQVLTLLRWQELSVSSNAFVGSCDGSKSSQGIQYSWSISLANSAGKVAVQSTSRDPAVFLLAPYSLQSLGLYTFSVMVEKSSKSAIASIQVLVQASDLVVVIAGGPLQSFQLYRNVTLDGSASYDKDKHSSAAAGLMHSWACYQTAPAFKKKCVFSLPILHFCQC